jgi:hypothetical protein
VDLSNKGRHRVTSLISEFFFQSVFYVIIALWVLLSGATLPRRILQRFNKTEISQNKLSPLIMKTHSNYK